MSGNDSISAVSNAGKTSEIRLSSEYTTKPTELANNNVPMVEPHTQSFEDLERKKKVDSLLKMVDSRIAKLNLELATANPQRTVEIRQQLQILQNLKDKREEYADFSVSEDGKEVTFTINDIITAERLKNTFFIKDGAFREELKAEYERGEENGVFLKAKTFLGIPLGSVLDYGAAVLTYGKSYTISSDMLADESALDEYIDSVKTFYDSE